MEEMKGSKRKILKLTGLSNEVFEIIRFELNMFLVRLQCAINPAKISRIKKYTSQDSIRLNVGAGPYGEAGWVNVDMFMFKNIAFTYDTRKKLPFRDNSVAVMRCEHVVEHMDRVYEAMPFLKESLRILQPGGVIRIIVPDIEKYVKAYYEKNWKPVGVDEQIDGTWRAAEILTHTFRQGGEHKYGYDFIAMKHLLNEAGFNTVNRMEYRTSSNDLLKNDQPNHQPYSLYVEAVKN